MASDVPTEEKEAKQVSVSQKPKPRRSEHDERWGASSWSDPSLGLLDGSCRGRGCMCTSTRKNAACPCRKPYARAMRGVAGGSVKLDISGSVRRGCWASGRHVTRIWRRDVGVPLR